MGFGSAYGRVAQAVALGKFLCWKRVLLAMERESGMVSGMHNAADDPLHEGGEGETVDGEETSDVDIGLAALGSVLMTPGLKGKRIELEAVWEVWQQGGQPVAKLAFDPVWADVSPAALRGVDEAAYQRVCRKLRSHATAPATVRRIKLDLLWSAWESGLHEDAFNDFHDAEGQWLQPYALYRSFADMAGCKSDWRKWPEEWQGYDKVRESLRQIAEYEPDQTAHLLGFHAFVQYILWSQWRGLKRSMDMSGCRLATRVGFGIPWASSEGLEFAGLLESEGKSLSGLPGVPPPRRECVADWWQLQHQRHLLAGQVFKRLELEPVGAVLDHLLAKKGVNFSGLRRPSHDAIQHASQCLREWAAGSECEWAVRLGSDSHHWQEELFHDAGWLILRQEG